MQKCTEWNMKLLNANILKTQINSFAVFYFLLPRNITCFLKNIIFGFHKLVCYELIVLCHLITVKELQKNIPLPNLRYFFNCSLKGSSVSIQRFIFYSFNFEIYTIT